MASRRVWSRRVLFTGLLLLLVPVACMVVSLAWPVQRVRPRSYVGLERGQLVVVRASFPMNTGLLSAVVDGARDGSLRASWWRPRVSEAWAAGLTGPRITMTMVSVPLGAAGVAVAVLTGAAWLVVRRRSRPGHCAECGYDLSGLRERKCPECGFVMKLVAWLGALVRRRAVGPVARC